MSSKDTTVVRLGRGAAGAAALAAAVVLVTALITAVSAGPSQGAVAATAAPPGTSSGTPGSTGTSGGTPTGGTLVTTPPSGTGSGPGGTPWPTTPGPCTQTPTPPAAPGDVVHADGGEGNLYGWTNYGIVPVSATTAVAHSGTHSVQADGLGRHSFVSTWVRVPSPRWYRVTAWVRLPAGRPAAQIALRPEAADARSPIASAQVTSAGWTRLTTVFYPRSENWALNCIGASSGSWPAETSFEFAVDEGSCAATPAPAATSLDIDDVEVTALPDTDPKRLPRTAGRSIACPPAPPATCTVRYHPVQDTISLGEVMTVTRRSGRLTPSSTLRWAYPFTGDWLAYLWRGVPDFDAVPYQQPVDVPFTQSEGVVTVPDPGQGQRPGSSATLTAVQQTWIGNWDRLERPVRADLDGQPCTLEQY